MKTLGISELKTKYIDELKKVQETGKPLLVILRKRTHEHLLSIDARA